MFYVHVIYNMSPAYKLILTLAVAVTALVFLSEWIHDPAAGYTNEQYTVEIVGGGGFLTGFFFLLFSGIYKLFCFTSRKIAAFRRRRAKN